MLIVIASRAVSHAASMNGAASSAAYAVTPPIAGSSSFSSSSSSLDDRREFCELIHMAAEARQWYSNATCEVGRLELCLDVIGVSLSASERETVTVLTVITDT